ncbi:PiggyBac transposable element-derived protein 3 [Frankliniella fusca]|uniref:PiggyBac transposable element-derived protein 3 n=1 Tax=Frankliniella fusca TaxID=407009 RepID=A0AAE1GXG1_9NEOP|nr:PiggyBac transposable element-derived protein 3 [Frankliniella fusca]
MASSRARRLVQLAGGNVQKPPDPCREHPLLLKEFISSPCSNPMTSTEKVQAWAQHARSQSCPGFKVCSEFDSGVIPRAKMVRRVLFDNDLPRTALPPIPEILEPDEISEDSLPLNQIQKKLVNPEQQQDSDSEDSVPLKALQDQICGQKLLKESLQGSSIVNSENIRPKSVEQLKSNRRVKVTPMPNAKALKAVAPLKQAKRESTSCEKSNIPVKGAPKPKAIVSKSVAPLKQVKRNSVSVSDPIGAAQKAVDKANTAKKKENVDPANQNPPVHKTRSEKTLCNESFPESISVRNVPVMEEINNNTIGEELSNMTLVQQKPAAASSSLPMSSISIQKRTASGRSDSKANLMFIKKKHEPTKETISLKTLPIESLPKSAPNIFTGMVLEGNNNDTIREELSNKTFPEPKCPASKSLPKSHIINEVLGFNEKNLHTKGRLSHKTFSRESLRKSSNVLNETVNGSTKKKLQITLSDKPPISTKVQTNNNILESVSREEPVVGKVNNILTECSNFSLSNEMDAVDLSKKSNDLIDLSKKPHCFVEKNSFEAWCDEEDNRDFNNNSNDSSSGTPVIVPDKSLPSSLKCATRQGAVHKFETPSTSLMKKQNFRKKIFFSEKKDAQQSSQSNLITGTLSCGSEESSRYEFRTRTPRHPQYSDSEEFSSDEEVEWLPSDPRVKENSNSKILEMAAGGCDSDMSEEDQILVTVPKRTTKAWQKKLAPKTSAEASQENSNQNLWEASDIVYKERETMTYTPPAEELVAPIEYFEYFFDDTLIDLIVEFTNIASTVESRGLKCINVTKSEMRKFFGIWIFMSIVQLPSLRDYWLKDTQITQVSKVMSYNRFSAIRAQVHLYDKSKEHLLDRNDRYCKVRSLLNHMREKCLSIEQEEDYSIDETMVPYKGKFAGNLRQFIKTKPHKFGIKLFNLAGASGMVYDFLPYAGSSTFYNIDFTDYEASLGVGAQIVIHLCRQIDNPESKAVFHDNYFSSIKLARYLLETHQLRSMGTIKSNRIEKCPLKSDKELTQEGRGSFDFKMKDGVQVIKWFDNKPVHLVTTLAGVAPLGQAQRYDKKTKARGNVQIPQAIQIYNKKMGGVDLHDMLIELYRSPFRGRRWYMSLISYMLDVAMTNSWLLYRRHASTLRAKSEYSLKQFRLAVSSSLRGECGKTSNTAGKPKTTLNRPRGYLPDDSVRFDGFNHVPAFQNGQSRCKFCKNGFTTVLCVRCDVSLCFVPTRQCFSQFHLQDKN